MEDEVGGPSGSLAWDALPDPPPGVDGLLRELVAALFVALGDSVVGLYLHGSLACGDFDPEASDLDLLVAVSEDLDDEGLERLRACHAAFDRAHPAWADRIDVAYLSREGLRSFHERECPIVVFTPGEPLHRTRTDPGWRMNWYDVRERGVTLWGPPARELVAEVGVDDFVAAVRVYMGSLPYRAERSSLAGFRAYAVLSACRGLHACRERRQASKPQAARWAAARHPEWAEVIRAAVERRAGRRREPESAEAAARAVAFVRFAVDEIGPARPSGPGSQEGGA